MTAVVSREHARAAWLTGVAGLVILAAAFVMMACAAPSLARPRPHGAPARPASASTSSPITANWSASRAGRARRRSRLRRSPVPGRPRRPRGHQRQGGHCSAHVAAGLPSLSDDHVHARGHGLPGLPGASDRGEHERPGLVGAATNGAGSPQNSERIFTPAPRTASTASSAGSSRITFAPNGLSASAITQARADMRPAVITRGGRAPPAARRG
jgi:hypothetical protein